MPLIVPVDDLIDYMSGINLNPSQGQRRAAEFILAGVQADLERYLNRPLTPTVRTESVPVNSDGSVRTSLSPIISIPAGTTSYYLRGDRLFATSLYRDASLLVGDWFHEDREPLITVTYTGGYDGALDEFADVRLAILRVASREMTNRHDDTLTVKGLNTDPAGEPTGPQNGVQGWTMDELRQFDRLRKRVYA